MILLSYVGNHDDLAGNHQGYGAIVDIFRNYSSQLHRVFLLATPTTDRANYVNIANDNADLIRKYKPEVKIDIIKVDLPNPIDYDLVYPITLDTILKIMDENDLRDSEKIINITSGTPTMAACWILLQQSGLIPKARLVQSFEKKYSKDGQTTREVNFNIDDFPKVNAPDKLKRQLTIEVRRSKELQTKLSEKELDDKVPELIGQSKEIREIKDIILRDIRPQTNVLITGEKGTGKGVVAKAIWRLHHKPDDQVLATYDLGTVEPNLAAAQLFGYKKGAFTGADKDHDGILLSNSRHFVFLDEIGNLPREKQQMLLRVISDKEILKIGSNKTDQIDVTVLAATNKDIEDDRIFAQDLKDRFDEVIEMPSLAERRDDIPLLVDYFMTFSVKKYGLKAPLILHQNALAAILRHDWPGNVRELEKFIDKLARHFSDGGEIHIDQIPKRFFSQSSKAADEDMFPELPLKVPLKDYIEKIKENARKEANGNMAEMDRLLGQKIGVTKQQTYRRRNNS